MAEIDNYTEISENFDTVKTLLNSIRAQGILNTSDVDKLLSGINEKLAKLNTEEDIDIIKVFLTELKQSLEERHNILVSKFGAIESLFSNLLKNSNELPKASELKELFDVVATNLSVFSREVVSQKEKIDDIGLRLDAIRSDDSQKKDIIKNITLLKPDLDRLSNGFDTIVLSLNDNFKTIVKAISTIDKTEYLEKFSGSLNNIEMSSNTLLSAIQMLDKKAEGVDNSLQNLVTKNDLTETGRSIEELKVLNASLNDSVGEINKHYSRIDTLADKIDASVNIIATLKSTLEDIDDKNAKVVLGKLEDLGAEVNKIITDTKFEDFKISMAGVLKDISENTVLLDRALKSSTDDIKKISEFIEVLDIKTNFGEIISALETSKDDVKNFLHENTQKLMTFDEANVARIVSDITSSAEALNSRLGLTQAEISSLCENKFGSVFENIEELKKIVSQIDDNGISSYNAMFSNITDRLNMFENMLKETLEIQENSSATSLAQLNEQIDNIKNLSSVLDYKMDSSVVEVSNMTRNFETLKASVDSVLALDFVNTVKDLRADLYASKQEMSNSFEIANGELAEKVSNDLFGKYELVISKLENVEEDLVKAQKVSLNEVKDIIEKISASIVDVLSYVSVPKSSDNIEMYKKLDDIAATVNDTSLNYIENVRDVVDVIRVQVENNIKSIDDENERRFEKFEKSLGNVSESIKSDIKNSYDKLLEIQDSYKELEGILNSNSVTNSGYFEQLSESAKNINSEFDDKLNLLKSTLLEKISEFKQNITCENTDNAAEVKFAAENLHNKTIQSISEILESLKKRFEEENNNSRTQALAKLLENFIGLKEYITSLNDKSEDARNERIKSIDESFDSLREHITSMNGKSGELLNERVQVLVELFGSLKATLDKVDENVDGDLTRQLSILESNFESLVSQISILFEKSDKTLSDRINEEFSDISEKMNSAVAEKLESYKTKIEETFDRLGEKSESQSSYLQERVADINLALKAALESQAESNLKQINDVASRLKLVLDEHLGLAEVDYIALKDKINEFASCIETSNETLVKQLKAQLDDITKYVDSVIEIQSQEAGAKYDVVKKSIEDLSALSASTNAFLARIEADLEQKSSVLKELSSEVVAKQSSTIGDAVSKLSEQLELSKAAVNAGKDFIAQFVEKEMKAVSANIEKETDVIFSELVEQFDNLKKAQADETVKITNGIEAVINDCVCSNIEDLKSYLDVKTDNIVLSNKLDNLKIEMSSTLDDTIKTLNKMLQADAFMSSISDFKVANEILVNSAADKLNESVESFIRENSNDILGAIGGSSKSIEDKLALFDKKFIDTVVDKYEEIKLLSNGYNNSLVKINKSLEDIMSDFNNVKSDLGDKISMLVSAIQSSSDASNAEIRKLQQSFDNLRTQISSKSFDEAFQASINKQIASLEKLMQEQFGYLEDINEICAVNLPDMQELSAIVKNSVVRKLDEFSDKLGSMNLDERFGDLQRNVEKYSDKLDFMNIDGKLDDLQDTVEGEFKSVKSDIITQILNVFNQISFVAEQEEILDFVQDKHDELINVLSNIVTSEDKKISSIKEELDSLNDKINNIISSDGDIDYIYSLQDLESDIANLRLVLQSIRDNGSDTKLSELAESTENIYRLLETIKAAVPDKNALDDMAEDIMSISSRTNKLILASDESNKTLQDNLQDFKLVINDLDERTRNFARESGMDRIDSKLNAINTMIKNGEKTNQVFNQVFEYLAEWVDKAGERINEISDKVETLDDIGQIKSMLFEIKDKTQDSADSDELIETLSNVFDKQARKISSLENKVDKVIVETTITNNKFDLAKMEEKLNGFLVALGDKISSQQTKIETLESTLEKVLGVLEDKSTEQLTKKVGGMDRQIAKLNKSIEKIASHVVEK